MDPMLAHPGYKGRSILFLLPPPPSSFLLLPDFFFRPPCPPLHTHTSPSVILILFTSLPSSPHVHARRSTSSTHRLPPRFFFFCELCLRHNPFSLSSIATRAPPPPTKQLKVSHTCTRTPLHAQHVHEPPPFCVRMLVCVWMLLCVDALVCGWIMFV